MPRLLSLITAEWNYKGRAEGAKGMQSYEDKQRNLYQVKKSLEIRKYCIKTTGEQEAEEESLHKPIQPPNNKGLEFTTFPSSK